MQNPLQNPLQHISSRDIQLLAAPEGGEERGSPTGDNAAPASQNTIEAAAPDSASGAADLTQTPDAPPAAQNRLSWDDIMRDPEYNRAMQDIVSRRLKASKSAEEKLLRLAPLLKAIGAEGGDISQTDIDGLVRKIASGDGGRALPAPTETRDGGTAMPSPTGERAPAVTETQDGAAERNSRLRFMRARAEGEVLKKSLPGFDFGMQLRDPRFVRMVMDYGMPVEDAYHAIHHRKIERDIRAEAAKTARENAAKSIRAGALRPGENGSMPQGASITAPDYKDPQYRAALKERIYAASAKGRKIYPE